MEVDWWLMVNNMTMQLNHLVKVWGTWQDQCWGSKHCCWPLRLWPECRATGGNPQVSAAPFLSAVRRCKMTMARWWLLSLLCSSHWSVLACAYPLLKGYFSHSSLLMEEKYLKRTYQKQEERWITAHKVLQTYNTKKYDKYTVTGSRRNTLSIRVIHNKMTEGGNSELQPADLCPIKMTSLWWVNLCWYL